MNKLLNLLGIVFLSGCSTYGSAFDCPSPDGKFSCDSVSKVSREVERDLTSPEEDPRQIIYVNNNFHVGD